MKTLQSQEIKSIGRAVMTSMSAWGLDDLERTEILGTTTGYLIAIRQPEHIPQDLTDTPPELIQKMREILAIDALIRLRIPDDQIAVWVRRPSARLMGCSPMDIMMSDPEKGIRRVLDAMR